MSKMTIIQLLNKIANGEEAPKKIKYCNKIYTLSGLVNDYMNEDGDYLTYKFDDFDILNDEVEILEEPKKIPGKMPYKCSMGDANPREQFFVDSINTLRDKINEILDYLERKGE